MLRDFSPHIYNENVEMNAIIDSSQPEFDLISVKMQNSFDDNFPIIATIDGILRWEIIFGITANPETENLLFRQQRILNRLASNIPFTERALQNIMNNIIGENGWNYDLDYNNYILTIQSLRPGKLWLNEMMLTLKNILPANMEWTINIYFQSWQAIYEDNIDWQAVYEKYINWQEVLEGIA